MVLRKFLINLQRPYWKMVRVCEADVTLSFIKQVLSLILNVGMSREDANVKLLLRKERFRKQDKN